MLVILSSFCTKADSIDKNCIENWGAEEKYFQYKSLEEVKKIKYQFVQYEDASERIKLNIEKIEISVQNDTLHPEIPKNITYIPAHNTSIKFDISGILDYSEIKCVEFNFRDVTRLTKKTQNDDTLYIDKTDELCWRRGKNIFFINLYDETYDENHKAVFEVQAELNSYPFIVDVNPDTTRIKYYMSSKSHKVTPFLSSFMINYPPSTDTSTIKINLNGLDVSDFFKKSNSSTKLRSDIELDSSDNELKVLLSDKDNTIPPALNSITLPVKDNVEPIFINDLVKRPLINVESLFGSYFSYFKFSLIRPILIKSTDLDDRLPLFHIYWTPVGYSHYSTIVPSEKNVSFDGLIDFHTFSNSLEVSYRFNQHEEINRNTYLAYWSNDFLFNPSVRNSNLYSDYYYSDYYYSDYFYRNLIKKSKINYVTSLGIKQISKNFFPGSEKYIYFLADLGIRSYFNSYPETLFAEARLNIFQALDDVSIAFFANLNNYISTGIYWFGFGISLQIDPSYHIFKVHKIQTKRGEEYMILVK